MGCHEVRGQVTSFPFVLPYGSGVNPAGSPFHSGGSPSPGQTVTLSLTNPVGTQAPGGLTLLAISDAQDPFFAATGVCTLLAGWGMAPGAVGELLVDVAPPNPAAALLGSPWFGPTNPSEIPVPIPVNAGLVGKSFYAQGLIVDPFGVHLVALTGAVELHVGS